VKHCKMKDNGNTSKPNAAAALKVLLTDTNRWPMVARLAISFSSVGCDVAVLCPTPGHPAEKVSTVGPVYHYSGLAPLRSLQTAIEAFGPDLIVPSCDRGVEHLHQLHALARVQGAAGSRIGDLIERSLGSPEGFATISSRGELLNVARSEGVPVPSTAALNNEQDLQTWVTMHPAPWVIKADGTWGGRGVRIVRNVAEAKRAFPELAERPHPARFLQSLLLNRGRDWLLCDWRQRRRPVIAQTVIRGRPANCAVVCWKGKILAGIAVEVVRARGSVGPATVVKVVDGPKMLSAAVKIAHRLRISGFFGLDFMIEEGSDTLYLIEMNPRCTPPCSLGLGEGRNLVAALWTHLTGRPAPKPQTVVDQKVIAYFPQAEGNMQFSATLKKEEAVYLDVPQNEPALVHELLHPWVGRSLAGRLLDLACQRRSERNPIVGFAVGETPASATGYPAPL
jgi:glutathione synthase/RimK-type ligase-like ATP-grasp enzyme